MTDMKSREFVGFEAGYSTKLLQYLPWYMAAIHFAVLVCYILVTFTSDLSQLRDAYVFNVGMGIACLGGLTILSIAFALERVPMDNSRWLFVMLVLGTMVGIVTDNMGWLLDGRPEWRNWNLVSSFVSYLVYPLLSPVFWAYQHSLMPDTVQISHRSKMIIWIVTVVNFLYICVGTLTGFLYTVDEMGHYHAGAGYGIAMLYPVLMMTITAIQNFRQKMALRKRLALLSFALLPAVAGVLSMFTSDISFGYVVGFCDLLLIYGVVQMERSIEMVRQQKEIAEKNQELAEQQMQIMVSQIQPHFMYNALGTISALCTEEPELAQEATDTFSDYLRANLNAMGQRQPVSFENELKHVKSYVWIEELRFQDYLHVEYDIQSKDFLIPALSVQPLVENAIKHGVCKKEDGGTVWISSYETEDAYYVVVKDDGVGFDVNAPMDPSRSHVGLQNVRSRLAVMVGGTLAIESEPGKGTISTITIKK